MKKLVVNTLHGGEEFAPPAHAGTINWRIFGPKNGSDDVEIIWGEMNGEGVADTHTHENFDQFFMMIEGALRIVTADEDVTIHAGECIMIPRGLEHTIYIASEEMAKYFIEYAPPKQRFVK